MIKKVIYKVDWTLIADTRVLRSWIINVSVDQYELTIKPYREDLEADLNIDNIRSIEPLQVTTSRQLN